MPLQQVPGSDLKYLLICYDKKGKERDDDPSGDMSRLAIAGVRDEPITDVFITSHGWKGDVPAAIDQYDRWIGAMAACDGDRAAVMQRRPDFKSLIVGFHWPSQPWGDEELGMGGASFAPHGGGGGAPSDSLAEQMDRLVEAYADRLADTAAARKAIRTIVDRALTAGPASGGQLPPEVVSAYATLNEEAGLGAGGASADPGSDRESFDPNRALRNARLTAGTIAPGTPGASISFAGPSLSNVLSPLRQLSFWKMKDRARKLGETAGFGLLTTLMKAVPANRKVRFHLMGHSFGCIVVSSMLNGRDGTGALPRPVDSLLLVQGATSLWGFCSSIPKVDKPGHFRQIVEQRKVAGPIITTQSKFDTAVGVFYPVAAGVAMQRAFPTDFPTYGGLGAFGIQGPGLVLHDLVVGNAQHAYTFEPGHVYNLNCNTVIKDGSGASGAHSDIAKPEVAHAMWEAVKSH